LKIVITIQSWAFHVWLNYQYIVVYNSNLKSLVFNISANRHITDHNIYRLYLADEKDCGSCSLTQRCFYRKNTRRRSLGVPLGADKANFSKLMQDKVDSDRGRKIYTQRFAILEPVFANIKTQKRLNRFTLRGKVKVNI